MNIKNCIIIHGCPNFRETGKAVDVYYRQWIPWTKKELVKNHIDAYTPKLPIAWKPDYKRFRKKFDLQGYTFNRQTALVGHSCGATFLVRWLGDNPQIHIGKLILVAPWKSIKDDMNDPYRKAYYGFKINGNVRNQADSIVYFTSDNEELAGKDSLAEFHKVIGGKIITLDGRGHYVGIPKLPELISEIVAPY
jgi:hypothetical protein